MSVLPIPSILQQNKNIKIENQPVYSSYYYRGLKMGLTKYFQLFQLISSKGLVFFLGDDAGFEANTYNDFSIKTKGQSSDKFLR